MKEFCNRGQAGFKPYFELVKEAMTLINEAGGTLYHAQDKLVIRSEDEKIEVDCCASLRAAMYKLGINTIWKDGGHVTREDLHQALRLLVAEPVDQVPMI